MNLSAPDADGPEIVTQESLLLGAAERIERIRAGRVAVRVSLSGLKPQNRQEGHIRIALRMLEPMVDTYHGQMFLLGNSDIVFMLKEPDPADVETMLFKLRALFSKDPLTYKDEGDGVDHFCTWFDLGGDDYGRFLDMVQAEAAEVQSRPREKVLKPLSAKLLGGVLERLSSLDVTALIHRQSAIAIKESSSTAEVLFQEFFVSMSELQKTVAPDVDILANPWLFRHLSQTLDRQVLGAVARLDLGVGPNCYSLNLNISTVLSKSFAQFESAVDAGAGISVELQVLDALADSQGYYTVRSRLRDKGHKVVIDGVNETILQFMEVSQFDADLYKLAWSPELREAEHSNVIGAAVASLGTAKAMLTRCDSEAAIQWGLERGIQQFQGRYVDAMLTAYTMALCPSAARCTLNQCMVRHGAVTKLLRSECFDNDMLDSSPVMHVPKAKGHSSRDQGS